MTDSNELIERVRGDIESIISKASGNAGEYKYSVLRETVIQECEKCGHDLLGVIRVDSLSGTRRYCYMGYCRSCFHVQKIVKGPFTTRLD